MRVWTYRWHDTAWGDGRQGAAPTPDRDFRFLLLLGNLKQHNQLLLIQMDWINLILVQGHESGWRKLGRGVRWWWWWVVGEILCVGDEAWKEMKLAVGGGRGRAQRTGECELNAERIRMNDDKIGFLFSIFLSSLLDSEGKRNVMFVSAWPTKPLDLLCCRYQWSDISHSNNNIMLPPSDRLTIWKWANVAVESSPNFLSGCSINALFLFNSNLALSDSQWIMSQLNIQKVFCHWRKEMSEAEADICD